LSVKRSEVASEAGVNVQTLRYYERRGLLPEPARRPSGYRDYAPSTVQRVRFIKRAQQLGFTLAEITELLAVRQLPDQAKPAARALAAARIAAIDEKVRQLSEMRSTLSRLVEACACQSGSAECPIIETLETP
jgi:Hg(II)-responsive transcriptional regulator